MNRRDYAAYAMLRDTARMDRARMHSPAVVIHRPRRRKSLGARIAYAVRSLFV